MTTVCNLIYYIVLYHLFSLSIQTRVHFWAVRQYKTGQVHFCQIMQYSVVHLRILIQNYPYPAPVSVSVSHSESRTSSLQVVEVHVMSQYNATLVLQ